MSKGKQKKKLRISRFIGPGNIIGADGHRTKGWQVKCSRCGKIKVVGSSIRPLPPEIVIKKLTQAGWFIKGKEQDDLCDVCYRAPIHSHVELAKKTLTLAATPMVMNGSEQMHFSEVLALTQKLGPSETKQLIKALREQLPVNVRPKKVIEPPIESDEEYRKWLEQQQ